LSKAKTLLIIVVAFGSLASTDPNGGTNVPCKTKAIDAGQFLARRTRRQRLTRYTSLSLSFLRIDTNLVATGQTLRWRDSGKLLVTPEQNSGFIWKILYRRRRSGAAFNQVIALHTLTADGAACFIHSGTHEELIEAFRRAPAQLAQAVRDRIGEEPGNRNRRHFL
jgi:hypothetical protein